MPKYRATVRVSGLTGETPRAVRAALDEQLRKSGLQNCGIVAIDIDAPPPTKVAPVRRPAPAAPARRHQNSAGELLLVTAATLAIWFFWWILTAPPD
jgi:flagellar biosynthesis/type III secretory pathway ATPase